MEVRGVSLRKLIDSPWIYFALAAVALLAAVLSQFERIAVDVPSGKVEDLSTLGDRSDLNVLFILIDTLRADRLSAYGYPRETTPNIDALAARGIRFANVESQSSWTKASMASLWTGIAPEQTGVLRFFHALPEEATLPAEVFQRAGFRTAGVWRNGWPTTSVSTVVLTSITGRRPIGERRWFGTTLPATD